VARSARGWAAGAVTALALAACSAAPSNPRLVLLYATCTLNRSFLTPYEARVAYTPNLARFASEGVVFERHQTESGQSGVAFASLFTGTQADRHGVYTIPQRLSDDARLVTEVFREAGWDVHAWLGHPMAAAALGYAQGVEPRNVSAARLEAGDPRFERVLDDLRANPGAKAFLLTNFTVTHGPYQGRERQAFCRLHPGECARAPAAAQFRRLLELYRENDLELAFDFAATVRRLALAPSEVRELAAVLELLYAADVFHLDRLFGAVLDRIARAGLLDETVVAFTADHGEVLFRENAVFQWSHSLQLAPEVLWVPLLVRAPGVAPRRYEAVTRSLDVLPTLATLAGIELGGPPLAGVDLAPALRGERPAPELLAFSHTSLVPDLVRAQMGGWEGFRRQHPTSGPEDMRVALRRGDRVYKLVPRGGGEPAAEVYDWGRDAGQTTNLRDRSSPEQRALFERLAQYRAGLIDAYARFAERDLPGERQLELLRSLGYVE